MALFKSAWLSYDEGKALKAIKRLTNQQLGEAAVTAPLYAVRRLAVTRVTESEVLQQIASTSDDWQIRLAAYEMLGDRQSASFEIAWNDSAERADPNPRAVQAAQQLSTEYKVKFIQRVASSRTDIKPRLALAREMIDTIADAGTLLQLFRNCQASISDLRSSVFRRLLVVGDTDLIERFARDEDLYASERAAAIRCVDNSDVMIEIAADRSLSTEERVVAIGHVSDPVVLFRIAQEDSYYTIPVKAVERMSDQQTLAVVAANAPEPMARKAAVSKLTDQSVLAELTLREHDEVVLREIAGRRRDLWSAIVDEMADSESVRQLANSTDDIVLRGVACAKLDGYVCASCKRANLPDGPGPASCTCQHCHADNHVFEKEIESESLPGHAESVTTWYQCRRCRLKKDEESHIRFTDW